MAGPPWRVFDGRVDTGGTYQGVAAPSASGWAM